MLRAVPVVQGILHGCSNALPSSISPGGVSHCALRGQLTIVDSTWSVHSMGQIVRHSFALQIFAWPYSFSTRFFLGQAWGLASYRAARTSAKPHQHALQRSLTSTLFNDCCRLVISPLMQQSRCWSGLPCTCILSRSSGAWATVCGLTCATPVRVTQDATQAREPPAQRRSAHTVSNKDTASRPAWPAR